MKSGLPVVVVAAAATLGAAIMLPLPADCRATIGAAIALLGTWACRRDELPHIRALVAAALVVGTADAWLALRNDAPAPAGRISRYACTVLASTPSEGGTTSFTCALDKGPSLLVQGRNEPPMDGARTDRTI